MTEQEKITKLLMNAYVNLCKAEKILKGGDDNSERTELNQVYKRTKPRRSQEKW